MMLSETGLTLSDVKLVNINFALSPSLISGKVDAVIGAFRNFELNQLDLEKQPGLAFYPDALVFCQGQQGGYTLVFAPDHNWSAL